jgi:hypothetical protein
MKGWQSILLAIGLQAGQIFVPMIRNEQVKQLASGSILILGGLVAKQGSKYNPDGTPAEVAYTKEKK